jgi:indole-3-acetate monooxygenase
VASDDQFARKYFATQQTIATSGAARVLASPADDVPRSETYVVQNARWPYVSGCIHADFVGGMVMIAGAEGVVETRLVLQPIEEATIRPTWDTLGLRASASHDVDLGEHVEVPAWRTLTWPELTVTRPGVLANATTTVAMIAFSAAAVMLGAARRAVEVAVESAEQKRRPLDKLPLVEQAGFVRGFAGLYGRLDLATAGLQHLLDELWRRAGDGEAPDAIGRARLRLAATDAVTTGADVVRGAALLVGADATHRSHPLERLTRDSQMLVHHVSVNAPSQERLGTVLLGSYRAPAGLI